MKKKYVTPQMQAVKINQSMNLLSGSPDPVGSADGNAFKGGIFGGGGSGRSRECDWDDEW